MLSDIQGTAAGTARDCGELFVNPIGRSTPHNLGRFGQTEVYLAWGFNFNSVLSFVASFVGPGSAVEGVNFL